MHPTRGTKDVKFNHTPGRLVTPGVGLPKYGGQAQSRRVLYMMGEHLLAQFEEALADDTLRELVREMEAEGLTQVEIYERFEQFRALLRELDREADEEQVMDTMDSIVGWCSPHVKLFPHSLTNEDIEAYRQNQRGDTPKQESES